MATGKRGIGRVTYEDPKKALRGFEQSWEANLRLLGKVAGQKGAIEEQSALFRKRADEFEQQVGGFQEFLVKVPVLAAIRTWLEGKLSEAQWKERYFDNITRLFQKELIPLIDSRGRLIMLEYFIENGHRAILEEIRATEGWTAFEKEEIVQCYVAFSQSLARLSHNLVPDGIDPDRERVRNKAVSYETFIDFIPHLSERDALIAKLLYFCDLPMEAILTLKQAALNKKSYSIQIDSGPVVVPRHLFSELVEFTKDSPGAKKLVFTNVRGDQVDRTHLNQSFTRACEKSVRKEKITPGTLLKVKSDRECLGLRDSE